jgi:hypothetical protein
LDAGVLSLMIYPSSAVPRDFKTGKDIEHASERIDGLIKTIEGQSESIVIATPALSEALVVVVRWQVRTRAFFSGTRQMEHLGGRCIGRLSGRRSLSCP